MKRFIIISLILVMLLCACGQQVPHWAGYSGSLDGYEYCHADERDRMWEEDILFYANTFLTEHPLLVDDDFMNLVMQASPEFGGYEYVYDYSSSVYSQAAREEFLAQINRLIPEIGEYTDTEIVYELARVTASLSDAHSAVDVGFRDNFPLQFARLSDGTGMGFYPVAVSAPYEELLLQKLVAVNDVPIADIAQRLSPYISHENDEWVMWKLANPHSAGFLTQRAALEIIGVMEPDDSGAAFTFEAENGVREYTIECLSAQEYAQTPMITRDAPMWRNGEYYWYELLDQGGSLYVRFQKMHEEPECSMSLFLAEARKALRNAPEPMRIIFDLRDNPGGYSFMAEMNSLISAVNQSPTDGVYVLINEGTFSAGVQTAYRLANGIEGAKLVGSPTGQFVNSFSTPVEFTLPNHGYPFYVSSVFLYGAREESGNALCPDILVYQTLDDYKRNRDTVLEYVLGLD